MDISFILKRPFLLMKLLFPFIKIGQLYREDVTEISGHGSPYILSQILQACLSAGCTTCTQPGEFTQRAFLHGKMDLAQAEAVGNLIAANTTAAQQTALNQLRGGFSKDLNDLRDQLIHFAAIVEWN
nr:hypothetical protein [Candidatus Brachybacter algidus]